MINSGFVPRKKIGVEARIITTPKINGLLLEILPSVMYPTTAAQLSGTVDLYGVTLLTVGYKRGYSESLERQSTPLGH
jgi:hypothetical protein